MAGSQRPAVVLSPLRLLEPPQLPAGQLRRLVEQLLLLRWLLLRVLLPREVQQLLLYH